MIGSFQLFAEPQIFYDDRADVIGKDYTPNLYVYNLAFADQQLNYAAALSFLLGLVVFVCRTRDVRVPPAGGTSMSAVPTVAPTRASAVQESQRSAGVRARSPGAGRPAFPTLFMLAFLVYFLMPLGWLLVASTKSLDDLFSSFGLWFADFNLVDNIKDTFTQGRRRLRDWLRNTLMYSFVSAGGAALLAAAAGYGFAKFDFPGKNLLFWFVLGSVMVPTTALAIPTYLMFAELGFTNNPLSVIPPSLVSPSGSTSCASTRRRRCRRTSSRRRGSTARVSSGSSGRSPSGCSPGFVTVLLFTFVATWNNYFLPLVMLSEPKLVPAHRGARAVERQASAGGGATAAFNAVITGALLSIVPLIIAFIFLQRYWQSGLGSGGVKG